MPMPQIKVTNYSSLESVTNKEPRSFIEIPLKQKITQYIRRKKQNNYDDRIEGKKLMSISHSEQTLNKANSQTSIFTKRGGGEGTHSEKRFNPMRINQLTAVHQMPSAAAQGVSVSAIRLHEEPTVETTVASRSVQ